MTSPPEPAVQVQFDYALRKSVPIPGEWRDALERDLHHGQT
jgi:hypothetical protein